MKFRSPLLSSLLLALLLALGACKKEEDTTDYAARDADLIKAYIQANNLTGFEPQASGLYVAITQPGTGDNAVKGKRIFTRYEGAYLDGQVFDSNLATLGTFNFVLGTNQVIAGWEEGFTLLNKGSKATFLVPSPLAYGPSGFRSIPPNTVLRFDVEVVDIQ